MDIVQTIMQMISGNTLSKLSAAIGESETDTKSAVGTAVPALLAGLSHVSSTPGGAQKVISALNSADGGSADPLAGVASGQPGNVLSQGGSMLKSLFGGGTSGLGDIVSRVTGLGGSSISKLLALLAPMVMGTISKQFANQPLNASSLGNFFSSQKASIASALPSGFSIPGLSSATSAVQSGLQEAKNTVTAAGQTAYRETAHVASAASSSAARWAIPALVGLAILAGILWFAFGNRGSEAPPVAVRTPTVPALSNLPEVSQVRSDLSSTVSSISSSLADIKDSATAQTAMPKLRDIDTKLDTVKGWWEKMPDAAKSTLSKYAGSNIQSITDRMNDVLKIPGIPAEVRPVLESIATKVGTIAGAPASQYTLTPPIQASPTVRD